MMAGGGNSGESAIGVSGELPHKWRHYMAGHRPRKREEATGVRSGPATMVELWMAAVKEQGDDMLKKGSRRKMDMNMSNSEKLVMRKAKLMEREKRLDYGIFVMYYVDKLSKEETFDRTLKKEDVFKFRAHVVEWFLDHKHSRYSIHHHQ
ncbi:hypothetical protein ACLB2K_029594 [Fragaria x ananassa]